MFVSVFCSVGSRAIGSCETLFFGGCEISNRQQKSMSGHPLGWTVATKFFLAYISLSAIADGLGNLHPEFFFECNPPIVILPDLMQLGSAATSMRVSNIDCHF